MNFSHSKLLVLAFAPILMLGLAGCASTPAGETTTVAVTREGVPGGVVVQTEKITATVTGIDAAARKVTLVTPGGKKTTVTAGPAVVNFDQIRVGDQVKAVVSEEMVVVVRKPGEAPQAAEASAVALAPVGAKPGVFLANTVEVTAQVKAINLKSHKATLQFPDGTSKTFSVRKDVDLTKATVGQNVVIRTTEMLAISVEKP